MNGSDLPLSNEPSPLYQWPVEQARLALLLVHGLGEHAGRYAHVARFFNERGIAVLGIDMPGHGRSPESRGHARGLHHLFCRVEALRAQATRLFEGVPQVLFGHSMGGNVVLNYLLRRKPDVRAVIAASPWIRLPQPPPTIKVFAGRLMRYVWPSLALSNGLDPTAISGDPQVVEAYINDPLVHDRISAALGASMLDAAKFLDTYSGKVSVPLLLLHGSADRLTDWRGTSEFAERLEGPVTFQLWEGGYHELHNDLQKQQVLQAVYEWLDTRVLQDEVAR